jgi:hypothetical protein
MDPQPELPLELLLVLGVIVLLLVLAALFYYRRLKRDRESIHRSSSEYTDAERRALHMPPRKEEAQPTQISGDCCCGLWTHKH